MYRTQSRFPRLLIVSAGTILLASGSAQKESSAPPPEHASRGPDEAASLEVIGGAEQMGRVWEALSEPISVRVIDSNGAPLSDFPIRFEPAAGHGVVSVSIARTDSEGYAISTWTLGNVLGKQTLLVTTPEHTGLVRSVAAEAFPLERDLFQSHPELSGEPTAISATDWVVGLIHLPNSGTEGFIISPDGNLTTVRDPGGRNLRFTGVNSHGVAVGWTHLSDEKSDAVVWEGGVIRTLPILNGADTEASKIIADGTILGSTRPAFRYAQTVLWSPDGATIRLPESGPDYNFHGNVLLDNGWVAGSHRRPPEGDRPLIWKDGRLEELPLPDSATHGYIRAANAVGEYVGIVGYPRRVGSRIEYDYHPARWRNGRVERLDEDGATRGEAIGINDAGLIVGNLFTDNQWRAVYWKDGVPNAFRPAAAAVNSLAVGINNHGWILGSIALPGARHPVLWRFSP